MIPSEEIWKDVPGYEGLYIVSNLGGIKSLPKQVSIGGNPKTIRIFEGRYISKYYNHNGYVNVKLSKNNVGKTTYLHKVVASAFCPNTNNYTEVNHIDGDKSNNIASNLEWCDRSHNVQHSFDIGLNKVPKGKFNQPVIVLDTNTGIFYDSMKDAAIAKNLTYSMVKLRLRGLAKNNTGLINA